MNFKFLKLNSFSITLFLTTVTLLLIVPSASAGTIIKSPAYLGLQRGLVGCWNFDGAYTKVPDCSGNNNTGTITGTTRVGGKAGQALRFDGVDDTVNTGVNAMSGATSITVSVWFFVDPATFNADSKVLLDNTGSSPFAANGFNLLLDDVDNGGGNRTDGVSFAVDTATGDGQAYVAQNTITQYKWYHVVATYNGATSQMKIYIDGVPVNIEAYEGTGTGNFVPDNDQDLHIGSWTAGGNHVNGVIDEVRVYNRTLSATEISRLYRIGLGSYANHASGDDALDRGLAGYWTFNANDIGLSGTQAKDRSGNNNHGTISGTAVGAGKIGQALEFDGLNDDIDTATDMIGAGTVTVCSWFYSQSLVNNPAIISNGNLIIQILNSGALRVSSDGGGTFHPTDDSTIGVNRWYHTCVVRLSDGTATIFIDGYQALSSGNSGAPAGGSFVTIGSNQGANLHFDGFIDDVRVYNRALSSAEIANLYKEAQSKLNSSQTDSLAKGLVGCWNFDGAYTKVPDCSGNNNTGTINGSPGRVGGKIGQALDLNGSSNYISVTDPANGILDLTTHTVSLWFKAGTWPGISAWASLFSKGSGNTANFYAELTDSDDISCGFGNGAVFNEVATNNPGFTVGVWYNLVCVFDNVANTHDIYINGVRYNQVTGETEVPNTNTNAFTIGAQDVPAQYFDGTVDDVRVYNRALSAGEVQKLYNMGR